jgi:hypothetical protein
MSNERAALIRRISAAIAATAVLVPVSACGGDDDDDAAASDGTATSGSTATPTAAGDPTTTFANVVDDDRIVTTEHVGAIAGTDIYAAFALSKLQDDGTFDGGIAYFCDGSSVASWFRLVDSASSLTFENAAGQRFDATLAGDGTVTATVTLAGTEYEVVATEVDADGDAGLFLADQVLDPDLAADERAGWIVLADGSQRGAIRTGDLVQAGSTLSAGSTQVVTQGRDILLRAITHIIGLDKKS